MTLPKTRFTDHLIQLNDLAARGFARWAFVAGMTFDSRTQWWADGGQRERPHEGIDLCLYLDCQGKLRRLREGAQLPALYGGTVVHLCDDFLGRSVMIECDLPGRAKWYVMYGHTTPELDITVGQTVQEGELVARLAPLPPHKSYILPHLHVSLGWAPDTVPPDQLDWQTIPDVLTLCDPMQVLDRPFEMLEPAPGVTALRAMTIAGRFGSGRSDVSICHDDYLAEAYDDLAKE